MTDDYGQQNGPQISPQMFRDLFKPWLTRICSRIHEISPDVKVLLHSCGSVYRFIPDFIDAGVDALNPIQASAKEMDPAVLKREFGKDLVLWGGGVTAQTTLHHGTIDEIREEVRQRLDTMKPGGGYVFSVDHDIQENVAPEKIEAVFKTAQEYRSYR
jgi:uroporphyrinogen decarboxylase